ncbi:hypothetical protein [Mucilaginibacter gilvus]|nr:hypothetical protein [Mucilaginibacter gilvus]
MMELNSELRRQTLLNMAQKHDLQFTPAEFARFEAMDVIGVPLS